MEERGFVAAGGDGLDGIDGGVSDEQGVIEIVDGGADMAGQEIEEFANWRDRADIF
jgi:hypothetical protein